jgi:hypothetical protein
MSRKSRPASRQKGREQFNIEKSSPAGIQKPLNCPAGTRKKSKMSGKNRVFERLLSHFGGLPVDSESARLRQGSVA